MVTEEHFYYLNREPSKDGKRHIHTYECELKPVPLFLIRLGFFKNPQQALLEGQKYFINASLCDVCGKAANKLVTHANLYSKNKPLKTNS